MQGKTNVPVIRFAGFTDAWEQCKLEEIVDVYDGVHQTPDYKDNGIMFLSVENIATLKSNKYISEEAFKKDYKVYPQKGDILMTRIGDIGTPSVVETSEKLAFYVSLALLKPNGIDSHFLCNSILSPFFQKGLKNRTLMTAVPQKINKDEIGKVDIVLPNLIVEQQKIGVYFKHFNYLITLHQRKYSRLCDIKKSMLEKMFPKEGTTIPEIRFSGFTDAWKQRKVTDLLKNSSSAMKIGPFGSALKKEFFVEEGVKVYAQENVFTGDFSIGNYYITEEKYRELQSCELYPGDLVISMMGTIGACAIFPETAKKGIMNSHLLRLQFSNEVIPEYIMFLLKDSDLIKTQIDRLSVGSIMSGLSSSIVKKLVFPVPEIEEQKQIINYLKSIDGLLTLHQRKLERLQNIKKSFLEKMFV